MFLLFTTNFLYYPSIYISIVFSFGLLWLFFILSISFHLFAFMLIFRLLFITLSWISLSYYRQFSFHYPFPSIFSSIILHSTSLSAASPFRFTSFLLFSLVKLHGYSCISIYGHFL